MNKEQRMKCTEWYQYHNLNPMDKYHGDCVIRAVALMTDTTWVDTVHKMTDLGITKGLVLNDKALLPLYLKKNGFVECNEPRDGWNRKMTVKEFLQNNPDVRDFVAFVGSHHVTAVKDGKVHDIWNCSNETMHRYFVKVNVGRR